MSLYEQLSIDLNLMIVYIYVGIMYPPYCNPCVVVSITFICFQMMVHQVVAAFSLMMISIAGTYVEWTIVACREQTMKHCKPTLDQHLLLLLVLTTALMALIIIVIFVELVVIMLFARLQGRVSAATDETGGEDNPVTLSSIKLNKENV